MTTTSQSGARTYAVRIEYCSDSEPFAVDQHILSINADADVHAAARDLADKSPYSNARVPDLTCAITIVRQPPDDPDTPPSGSPAIIPRCPKCGADDISRDATARWDVDTQSWYLSGIFDCQTCEDCGAEGDDLAKWELADPHSAADVFLWAVANELQNLSLTHDAEFQRYCLDVHDLIPVDQAIAEWDRARAIR
jgi:hypothetical protein